MKVGGLGGGAKQPHCRGEWMLWCSLLTILPKYMNIILMLVKS